MNEIDKALIPILAEVMVNTLVLSEVMRKLPQEGRTEIIDTVSAMVRDGQFEKRVPRGVLSGEARELFVRSINEQAETLVSGSRVEHKPPSSGG